MGISDQSEEESKFTKPVTASEVLKLRQEVKNLKKKLNLSKKSAFEFEKLFKRGQYKELKELEKQAREALNIYMENNNLFDVTGPWDPNKISSFIEKEAEGSFFGSYIRNKYVGKKVEKRELSKEALSAAQRIRDIFTVSSSVYSIKVEEIARIIDDEKE